MVLESLCFSEKCGFSCFSRQLTCLGSSNCELCLPLGVQQLMSLFNFFYLFLWWGEATFLAWFCRGCPCVCVRQWSHNNLGRVYFWIWASSSLWFHTSGVPPLSFQLLCHLPNFPLWHLKLVRLLLSVLCVVCLLCAQRWSRLAHFTRIGSVILVSIFYKIGRNPRIDVRIKRDNTNKPQNEHPTKYKLFYFVTVCFVGGNSGDDN